MGFNDPRGSTWRKWDLHAHTPLDHEWINRPVLNTENQKRDFAKQYIEKALSEKLEVIAITDHNFCERFDELLIPYIQEEASKQGITIFPGFELTLREGSGVHVLIIFPEDTDLSNIDKIITKLLPAGRRFDDRQRPIMSDYSLVDTIKVLEEFKTNQEISNYIIIFAHADNENGVLDRSTISGEARVRLWNNEKVKICQLKKSPELYEDGFIKSVVNCLDRNYERPDMAYIIASDCRSLEPTPEEGRRYLGEKFTWIKADPTFEGLIHAIANPEERIYIGEQPPLLKRLEESPSKFIRKLVIKAVDDYDSSKGHWFKGVEIPFNPGMVAIIGHKGNGKSALADIIALCGNSHLKESHFSFLNERRFKKPPDNIAQFFEARIYWWDDDESQSDGFISLSQIPDKTYPERVKYIPQHYFEVLTADLEGQEDFEKEIKNMIFQHIPEEERYEQEDFNQLERFLSKAYIEEIEPLKREIEKLNEQIVSMEAKKLPEYIKHIKEKKAEIEKEIKNLDNILEVKIKQEEELRSYLENPKSKLSQINKLEEERRKYDEEINRLKNEKARTSKKLEELNYIKRWLTNLKSRVLNEVEEKRKILKGHGINPEEIVKIEIKYELIEKIENEYNERKSKIEGELSDREGQLKDIIKQKQELQQSLKEKEKEYQSIKDSIREIEEKKKELIGDITRPHSLKWLEREIEFVEGRKLESELRSLEEQRENLALEIFKKLRHRIEVYEKLKRNVDEVLSNYLEKLDSMGYLFSVEANISINREKFTDHFLNIIDGRVAGTFCGEEEGKKKLNELLNNALFSTEEDIKNFLEKITEALNRNLSGDKSETFPIKQVKGKNINQKKENLKELYDFIFCIDNYLEPKYELKLGDKELSLLSPGEKGALLIIFYLMLDQSDIPLVIDQPEENLDNESIYRVLIHFLNETKKRRQVIMVTHNPNLAVVADADQIINVRIDRASNYRFFAKHGSLENKNINKVVTDILEGTLDAFKIRDSRYIYRI